MDCWGNGLVMSTGAGAWPARRRMTGASQGLRSGSGAPLTSRYNEETAGQAPGWHQKMQQPPSRRVAVIEGGGGLALPAGIQIEHRKAGANPTAPAASCARPSPTGRASQTG